MHYRIASARPWSRLLAAVLATGLAFSMAPTAFAQKAGDKKPAAKPVAPAKPATTGDQNQAASGQPQLMYSPWMKVCGKGKEADAKEVCVTAKDGRIESGMPVVAVALIEPKGIDTKILRVTVPPGMHLKHGTRVIIDQNSPNTAPYVTCFPNGCMSDYEATKELVEGMKKGKTLTVQAINMNGAPLSLPLPLTDFAKAHDGPPTDPKAFEAQQRKLQEELQKRAEEARKKIENQTPPAAEKKK